MAHLRRVPLDPLPSRLVLTDWLDEHPHPVPPPMVACLRGDFHVDGVDTSWVGATRPVLCPSCAATWERMAEHPERIAPALAALWARVQEEHAPLGDTPEEHPEYDRGPLHGRGLHHRVHEPDDGTYLLRLPDGWCPVDLWLSPFGSVPGGGERWEWRTIPHPGRPAGDQPDAARRVAGVGNFIVPERCYSPGRTVWAADVARLWLRLAARRVLETDEAASPSRHSWEEAPERGQLGSRLPADWQRIAPALNAVGYDAATLTAMADGLAPFDRCDLLSVVPPQGGALR